MIPKVATIPEFSEVTDFPIEMGCRRIFGIRLDADFLIVRKSPPGRARVVNTIFLTCRLTFAQTAVLHFRRQRRTQIPRRGNRSPVCCGRLKPLLQSDLAPLSRFLLLWRSRSEGPTSTDTRSVPTQNGRSSLASAQELRLRLPVHRNSVSDLKYPRTTITANRTGSRSSFDTRQPS